MRGWRRRGGELPSAEAAAAAVARQLARLASEGPAPLSQAIPATDAPLRVAIVVPAFRRGSGGHMTIANLARGLEARGHELSFWIDDEDGRSGGPTAFREFFGPFAAEVNAGLEEFERADVALATGWQTVAPVLLLPGCAARAYLVQDHEPEFYGASTQRLWAQASYRHGLHCITAGPWLGELATTRYGATATVFDLGIDQAAYEPGDDTRSDDLVIFYARASTPRRAVPLGLMALEELHRRRPAATIALFGEPNDVPTAFPARQLGVLASSELAAIYRQATVGMVLSLTNHSLVAQEMAACGLPAVELDAPSTRAAFGTEAGITLAAPDPLALADALQGLLDDPARRSELARRGLTWTSQRTWARAAQQVESGLRVALSSRPG